MAKRQSRRRNNENATSVDIVWEFLYYHKIWEQGEPGEVLRNLAKAAGVGYGQASRAVIILEEMGLVAVDRTVYPHPYQSNRLIRIQVLHIGSRRRVAA